MRKRAEQAACGMTPGSADRGAAGRCFAGASSACGTCGGAALWRLDVAVECSSLRRESALDASDFGFDRRYSVRSMGLMLSLFSLLIVLLNLFL
jgi:hypothetical protein